jgi:hypothetical protein
MYQCLEEISKLLDDDAGFFETADNCTINMVSSFITAANLYSNNLFCLVLFFITTIS